MNERLTRCDVARIFSVPVDCLPSDHALRRLTIIRHFMRLDQRHSIRVLIAKLEQVEAIGERKAK